MTGRERNPFPARGTMSMEEHVRDTDILNGKITGPTVRLTAVDRLTTLVQRYLGEAMTRSQNSGQAVFLYGEHGSGKTHAIRYALGQAAGRARETDALRLYVKAQDGDFVALYRRLMSQVGQDRLRELSLNFRGVLAAEQFGARFGADHQPALLAAVRENPAQVAVLYDELLVEPGSVLEAEAGELERVSDNGQDFQRAMAGLLDPANEEAAYAWFTGRELDLPDAERLGVSGPLSDPNQCRFGLQLLAALATRTGRPIIMIIDQCERLVLDRPDNLGLLHSLVERIAQEAGMLLLSGSTAAWHALPDDLQQRFGGNHIDTSLISPAEARHVLSAYTATADGTTTFQHSAVYELLRLSGGNIRRLLQLAWSVVEAIPTERTEIDGSLVLSVAGATHITREDVGLAVERWLLGEKASFIREWRGEGVSADFAVLSDFGPQLLVEIEEALFTTADARRLLARFRLLDHARERDWPARILLIVIGYASPEALLLLRQAAHDVVVFTGEDVLDRLRGPALGFDAPSTPWDWRAAPYRGLASFREEDAGIFYGREPELAALVDRLATRAPGAGPLMVTGASGAGKSSLLCAGLLPALARGHVNARVARWPRIVLTPGREPLSELAVHLAVIAGTDALAVRHALVADPKKAHLLIRQALASQKASSAEPGLILVVDQFEEIFTLGDEEEGAAMVTALHAIATQPDTLVVIAVRADFIGRCADYPVLAKALNEGLFVLGPMDETGLRRAIVGPAMEAGLDVEPSLVDSVLADVGFTGGMFAAGALPLLSHAMLTVWQHRENGRLTLRAYARTGGITRGVVVQADGVYESLSPTQKQAARDLFLRLTTITHDGEPMRRPVRRHEVLTEDFSVVVEAFSVARIVIVDEASLQIAHDVLLRAWPRLRAWIEQDREQYVLYNRFLDAAMEWERAGRDPAFLYRGARLAAVLHASEHAQSDSGPFARASSLATDYLKAGLRTERRRTRLRQTLMLVLVVLTVTSLLSAIMAVSASLEAEKQRAVAMSRLLAEQSESFATNPQFSALLAVAAWRISPTPEARVSLETVVARPIPSPAVAVGGEVRGLDFSADGRLFVTGTAKGEVRLWDTRTRAASGPALIGSGSPVTGVAFSPDGESLAATRVDGSVALWIIYAGQVREPLSPLNVSLADPVSLAFSPSGRELAVAGENGLVRIANPATRRILSSFGTSKGLTSVAFSPDGKLLGTASADATVRLWDTTDAATPRLVGAPLTGHTDAVTALAFSPDGKLLGTASADATVRLWDTTDAATPRLVGAPLTGHTDAVTALAFSPDGRALVTGSRDRTVRLWDVPTHRQIGSALTGFTSDVTSVKFSPAGETFAGASLDGSAHLWTVKPTGDPVRDACAVAGRQLTPEEWKQFVPDLPYRRVC